MGICKSLPQAVMPLRLSLEIALVSRTENKDPGNTDTSKSSWKKGLSLGSWKQKWERNTALRFRMLVWKGWGPRHKRKPWRKQKFHQL